MQGDRGPCSHAARVGVASVYSQCIETQVGYNNIFALNTSLKSCKAPFPSPNHMSLQGVTHDAAKTAEAAVWPCFCFV